MQLFSSLIAPADYLAPIAIYAQYANAETIYVECYENFVKSTYRNRCHIASPNGVLRLSIPLEHGKNQRRIMRDVRISYEVDWQKNHWQSLIASYRSSPYFEYYEDDFTPFYHKKFSFLLDFNEELRQLIFRILGWENRAIQYTAQYQTSYADTSTLDIRQWLRPNTTEETLTEMGITLPEYYQVFSTKTGFLPNMSLVDLLFSQGARQTKSILTQIGTINL